MIGQKAILQSFSTTKGDKINSGRVGISFCCMVGCLLSQTSVESVAVVQLLTTGHCFIRTYCILRLRIVHCDNIHVLYTVTVYCTLQLHIVHCDYILYTATTYCTL